MEAYYLKGVIILLIVLSAASVFFSAVETALFALQPADIERLKARRSSSSHALMRLLETPHRLISAILLGDALTNAPLMVVGLVLLEEHGFAKLPFWVSALVIFAVIVFVCDLIPKLVGLSSPYKITRMSIGVLRWVMPPLLPIARHMERFSEWFANAITPSSLHAQRQLNEAELETLVELSEEDGTLHETESEMIAEIIKLRDKMAKDCMTPRVDAFTLPDDLTNEEAVARLKLKRFRRVPVYGETPDDIEGVLDVGAFLRSPEQPYTERLDVPSFVPSTMPAFGLLKNFLTHPQSMAIVVDEHGGVEGVVTLADLVEEIISDAVPRTDARLYIESLGQGRLLANGSARLEDIGEELGVTFEEEGIDTIGGLIFNRLGHLPKPGMELLLNELQVFVRRVSRKRVEEILIIHNAIQEAE